MQSGCSQKRIVPIAKGGPPMRASQGSDIAWVEWGDYS